MTGHSKTKVLYAKEYKLIAKPTKIEKVVINSQDSAQRFARQLYGDDICIYESFFLILLDRANNTIGWTKISQGGVASTYVDPRLIYRYVLNRLTSCVILVHNHPSGNLKVSEADKAITKTLKAGLEVLGIEVLDHLILTESGYLSFQEQGLL